MLLTRATMRATTWKLMVLMLVVAVLPSWWWTWRVEGFVLLLLLVVLTSLLDKHGLISWWQSHPQGVNLINDYNNGKFHLLKSCVDGLLVLCE
jgi:urea transporter